MKSDDLKQIAQAVKQELSGTFATKKDLDNLKKDMAKQKDLQRVEKKLDDLTEYSQTALGNIFKWSDEIHQTVTGRKRASKY